MKYFIPLLFVLLQGCGAYAQSTYIAKVYRYVETTLPSTCRDADVRANSADSRLYFCLSDTWYQLNGSAAALTANRAVVTDASGNLTVSATTDAEIVHVNGVTSALCGINQSCVETNKTFTSAVLNVGVSGTAVLDEDNLVSDSDTQLATQQSIKAYSDAHINDAVGAHAASAITNTPAGNLAATEIQAAVDELQTDVDTRVVSTLTDTNIYVGNVSNVATGVAVSGDIAMANTGAVSITAGAILDADVNASAAIALNKLAASTVDRVPLFDASGFLTASSVTNTVLGYLDLTSSGQTQLDAKLDDFTGVADNAIMRTDGTGGDTLQESGITISDTDALSEATQIDIIAQGELRLQDTTGGQYTGFKSPTALSGSTTFTLPDGDGINGQAMTTDGSGTLAWTNAGGGSGVNYWGDFQADTISNVAEFDDSGGSAIVDGTGGSPVSSLAAALESSVQLSGDNSYKLSKSGTTSRQWMGWSIDSDTPDRTSVIGGETVYITFNYETSANFATGDVGIYVYRIGSNTLEACNTRNVLSGTFGNELPKADDVGQYQCVTTLGSTDTGVRVIYGIIDSTTTNWDLYLDKIKVGPDAVITAPIVSGINTVTPTGTWTANTTYTGNWHRVGSYMHYNVKVLVSGAPTATTLSVDLPSGFTMDTSKMLTSDTTIQLPDSSATIYDSGSGWFVGLLRYSDSNTFDVYYESSVSSPTGVSQTAPMTFANNDFVEIKVKIPIAEWSSANAILSTTSVDHQSIGASTSGVAPTGTISGSYNTIIFGTVDDDPHGTYNTSTGIWTAPRAGKVDIDVGVSYGNASSTGAAYLVRTLNSTTSKFFLGVVEEAGTNSARFVSGAGTLLVSAGDTIVFQSLVTASTPVFSGTEAHFSIRYRPDLSTFSVYGVHETIESSGTLNTYSITAGQWGDLTSISLTPGTWDIHGLVVFNSNGATTTTNINAGVSTTSGNTAPTTFGDDYLSSVKTTTSGSSNPITFFKEDYVVTSTTTYYLKGSADTSITNLRRSYRIIATRKK